MNVFFTDSESAYHQSKLDKILTDGYIILQSTLFSIEEISFFNAQLNGVENEAARRMINELEEVAKHFPYFKTHPTLETRKSNYDKAYSLLYPNFKDYILPKYIIEILIERIEEKLNQSLKFSFQLSYTFKSIEFSEKLNSKGIVNIEALKSQNDSRFLKQLFYYWSKLKRKTFPTVSGVNHIALFIFDTANDIELFQSFFKLVAQDSSIFLSVIQLESGNSPDKTISAKPFESDNIRVYKLQDFRAPRINGVSKFEKIIRKTYPQYLHFCGSQRMIAFETYTGFIQAALKELQPHTVIYDNTGEIGRYVADTARYLGIQSANVEYGLFSDDYIHMASNIKFDVRYCLGNASIEVWKNKKDPTETHVPIGFLKLDNHNVSKPIAALEKNTFKKIIVFASTWAGTNSLYNVEKTQIIKELISLCKLNNWGLVIKKHPAENDTLIDQLVEVHDSNVFLFEHNQVKLVDLLPYADILCTQNSSVIVEALLYNTPTVFFNKSEQTGLAELIPMSNEPYVFFVHTIQEFERIVKNECVKLDPQLFEQSIERYLHKIDRNTSQRLIDKLKRKL